MNKDVVSKSDPMCVVYIQVNNTWIEHRRTERIVNTLNPDFATKILIGYQFEELQKLKFKIYDIDSTSTVLEQHDFLGEAECNLGQIVSSGNFVTPLCHPKSKKSGELCVRAEEIGSNKEEVEFLFSAEGFKKSGLLSKPDPFLAIYKDTNFLIYRSLFIKDNCNPRWQKFTVPMRTIRTKDGQDITLTLQCWNWNRDGNHSFMGEVKVSTHDILHAPRTFDLMVMFIGHILLYMFSFISH